MTGEDVFKIIYNGFLYVFMITTFLGIGISYTVAQLKEPLKRYNLMTRAVILNIILLPAIAFLFTLLFPVKEAVATGIILVAICPGAAFGPKLAQVERGDVPYSIGSMFLLAMISIITIPLSASLLLPGKFSLDPLVILQTLVLLELIPLLIALGLKAYYNELAEVWKPSIDQVSNISLIFLVVLMIISQLPAVISVIGSFALLISILLTIASLVLGYFMGGPREETRRVTSTTGTVRNNAVALLLAAPLQPLVTIVALVYAILAVVGGSLTAGQWAKTKIDEKTDEEELKQAA